MSGREAPFPAWAKLLLVLATLLTIWVIAQAIGQVLLVFVVSVVIALLLNPLVRLVRRLRIPRGLAVLTVFLGFIGVIVLGVILVIDPVRGQIEEINQNLPVYTDQAQRQADALQGSFDRRGIDVDVEQRASELIASVQERVSQIANDILSYSLDLLGLLVTLTIILVSTIYMLLDAPRIARFAEQLGGKDASAFLRRTERTLGEYLKAQLLVALIIALSAGIVLWIYGVSGLFPLGATFAVAFAAWVFLMEFIPYVGPILGAVPPTLFALFDSPLTALWVILAFLAIHQLESNWVVPKMMGGAVGVHPLVVIFGLLIGQSVAGLVGVLLAIPLVVITKETVLYAADQLGARRVADAVKEAVELAPEEDTLPAPTAPAVRAMAGAGGPTTLVGPTREIPTRPLDTRPLDTRPLDTPDLRPDS